MKIFISHSSANANIGNALVNLLTSLGISHDDVVFTSNDTYGIPTGEKIFDWLRKQISDKPFVIYLLSNEYYKSVACLNEMGAAWIIENDHVIIFTPGFDISSPEFQSGALDPREIGFFINNESRLLQFIESLSASFNLPTRTVVINQLVKEFLRIINEIPVVKKTEAREAYPIPTEKRHTIKKFDDFLAINSIVDTPKKRIVLVDNALFENLQTDILERKLNDGEIILFRYIIETGKSKLGIGWQESEEVNNIKEWEDINGINSVLSSSYSAVIRRLKIRRYLQDSAFTSSGNAKEVKVDDELAGCLFDFPKEVVSVIDDVLKNNPKQEFPGW